MNFVFTVAILFGMASFFNPVFVAANTPLKANGETYKDLISKSQNLVLQKDRQQAQLILLTALKSEKPGTKAHKDLRKTLNEVATVFLSDKAQQLHELSLSLKKADLAQAQQKIQEALRIEPDNLSLLLEFTRQAIAKNECKVAEDTLSKSAKLTPHIEELQLAQAQISFCLGDMVGFQKLKDDLSGSPHRQVLLTLEIEKAQKEKNISKAKELLSQLRKSDKSHPEIHFWSWKIEADPKNPNVDAAQKYLADCRNMTASHYRKLNLDPWLCRRTAEAENFLQSQSQSQ